MLLLISTSTLISFDYTSSSSSVELNFFMCEIAVFISFTCDLGSVRQRFVSKVLTEHDAIWSGGQEMSVGGAKDGPVLARSPNFDASHIQSAIRSISSFIWSRTRYPVLRLLNHRNLLAHHIALGKKKREALAYFATNRREQAHNISSCSSCLCLEECINNFLPIDVFDGEVLLLTGSLATSCYSPAGYHPLLMFIWCKHRKEMKRKWWM